MFATNYKNAILEGIENSKYSIGHQEIESNQFYDSLVALTHGVKQRNGRLFFFGNGASAAFSNHMALDWSKNGGINAYSLSDSALLTALSNDYSYEQAFVEYLKIEKCTAKDLVISVSSSGNSPNVVNALDYCSAHQIQTVSFSGLKPDNRSAALADYSIYVPMKTYGMVECIHQIFLHLWLDQYMKIKEWDKTEVQNMNAKEFKL
jgi:D-sedoheptulose 7-phosphate isomerase